MRVCVFVTKVICDEQISYHGTSHFLYAAAARFYIEVFFLTSIISLFIIFVKELILRVVVHGESIFICMRLNLKGKIKKELLLKSVLRS